MFTWLAIWNRLSWSCTQWEYLWNEDNRSLFHYYLQRIMKMPCFEALYLPISFNIRGFYNNVTTIIQEQERFLGGGKLQWLGFMIGWALKNTIFIALSPGSSLVIIYRHLKLLPQRNNSKTFSKSMHYKAHFSNSDIVANAHQIILKMLPFTAIISMVLLTLMMEVPLEVILYVLCFSSVILVHQLYATHICTPFRKVIIL